MKRTKTLRTRLIFTTVMMLTLIFSQSVSYSAFTSTTLSISAVVSSTCTINTDSVKFGIYDPAGLNAKQDLHAQGNFNVRCTRGTEAQININSGMNQGRAAGTTRAMVSNDGSSYLAYDLYHDQGTTTTWNSQSPKIYNASNSSLAELHVYAKIPANQDVNDGVYNDIVTVSITF